MAKHSKRARKAVPVLSLAIPMAALISVVSVAISMSTGNWLDSYERIPISNTSILEEFIIKRTISGLWHLCSFNISEKQYWQRDTTVSSDQMNCSIIEYFVKDRYISDPNDSTNAIRYAVTKAGPLFVVASIFLGFALLAAVFSFQRHRRIALFISGIVFTVSGLMLLIGLVVYLSALQSEIGPKLRPRNAVDMPQFSYNYGFSFILVVVGFLATETTGILAIFYYIYWHQLDWAQKLENNGNEGNGKHSTPSDSYRCHLHQSGNGGSGHGIVGNHRGGGYRITDIYDLNKRSNAHEGKLLPHLHSCNAYLLEKDKHVCGDFDIPFPPPPPPTTAHYLSIPRDYTTLTSCSDEEGSIMFPPPAAATAGHRGNKDRDHDHRNTPV